ncbi:D-allose-binding periplasmic protein precursor [Phycisphaerae bacterium RAS1]|nr:D-allose-binding periplasmic protein precursor [Phycisphaerae bacterium RAS1]
MTRILFLALTSLACFGCDRSPAPSGGSPPPAAAPTTASSKTIAAATTRVALIPKGTTHDFWKSMHAGARRAVRELGDVELIFRGPEKEDDRDQQIALMQNFISGGVSAIVVAPLDDQALLLPARQAMAAKIPVIVVDSGLKGDAGKDFVSFIATDNYKGGQLAAARMIEVLGGKGKVLMLRYQEGSASTDERERGFVDGLAKTPEMQLIDPKRYSGATRATAQEASENLLTAYTDMQGIYTPNESSTFGMLLALRSRGLAGKVRFVGFDASPGLIDALKAGEIDGLVVQNPAKMGYLGVKSAVDHLRGKPVDPKIDTGVAMVTKANVGTPEMKELVAPPGE